MNELFYDKTNLLISFLDYVGINNLALEEWLSNYQRWWNLQICSKQSYKKSF